MKKLIFYCLSFLGVLNIYADSENPYTSDKKNLSLFSDIIRKEVKQEYLNAIEKGLHDKLKKIQSKESEYIHILGGNLYELPLISPETPCIIDIFNSKEIIVKWELGSNIITVAYPLSYDSMTESNRSEIENNFISLIKSKPLSQNKFGDFETINLDNYIDSLYLLPGKSYQKEGINRNVYFEHAGIFQPVWNVQYPLESICNLLIYPSDIYGSTLIDLKVLKHEYGIQEDIVTSVKQLLAAAESEDCVPFFGIEKFENNHLEGALFLVNPYLGYNHTIKIECNPEEVIKGNGKLKGRASLFIPTHNIYNLYAPYIKKSEEEKIKYE